MFKTITTLLASAILASFTLSNTALAGKGAQSGNSSSQQLKTQQRSGDTYEYKKHLADKPKYQYKHTERHEYQKNKNTEADKQNQENR